MHLTNNTDKFALGVNITFSRVSKKENADFKFYNTNNPKDQNITYVSRTIDPNSLFIYTTKNLIEKIDSMIKNEAIKFNYTGRSNKTNLIFNSYCFDTIKKYYSIDNTDEYVYKFEHGKQIHKKYSEKVIVFIIGIIIDNPNIIQDIQKKSTPGA